MDLESAQNNALAKLPLLKQGDYDTWRLRIESYIQLQDYALWEIIEDGNSFKPVARTTTNADGTSTSTIPGAVTAEEKIQKKNDLKAQSILMMTLLSEHLLTFNQYKEAKNLSEAIEARFGENEATKKTQKTLLKQMYENFNASSSESLDSLFTRLQKIVSQLATLGENISQEDLNFKFLRSLPSEWSMHVVNVTFVSTPGSTNDVNTYNVHVSTASSSLSTASSSLSTASTTDNTARLNDLEEIDLKWQLALLSKKARKFHQRTKKNIIINGSDTAGYDKTKIQSQLEEQLVFYKKNKGCKISDNNRKCMGYNVVPPPPPGLFAPPTIDLSNSGLEEFKQPKFEGYGVKVNKSVSENSSNEIKKTSGAPIIEDWVSDCDEDETLEKVSESANVQKPKQVDQPRKIGQNPKNNSTNWNTPMSKKLGMVQKPILNNVKKGTGQREVRPVWNNAMRTNHQNFSNSRRNFAPTAVLTKSGLVPISTARQSSSRAAASVSTVRPIKTVAPKNFVKHLEDQLKSTTKRRKEKVVISHEEEDLVSEDPSKQERMSKTKYGNVETEHAEEESSEVHLDQGDYDTWRLRIESYIQLQYYALWEIIEDGNSFKSVARTTTNADGTSTSTIPDTVTAEEKIKKKNDLKARKQIHEDDLDEIDLKWQLALLSMKERKFYQRTGKKIIINRSDTENVLNPRSQENRNRSQDSSKRTVNVEESSSKAILDQLIGNQISNNNKKGLGYNAAPPPLIGLFVSPSIDLSNSGLEKFKQPEFEGCGVKVNKGASENFSKEVKKTSDAPIIEDWVSDCDEDETVVLESLNVQKPKQDDQPTKGTSQREVRPVWTNAMRVNHQKISNSRRNFAPTAVLTKSGLVPLSTARQSFSRTTLPISAARSFNTDIPSVNVAKPRTNAFQKSHSSLRRPFYQQTTLKNRNLNNKVNTAKVISVNTVKGKRMTSAVGLQGLIVVKLYNILAWDLNKDVKSCLQEYWIMYLVLNSPCFTANSWLVQDQTVLGYTLGSGEDSLKLIELMDLCTKLIDKVTILENALKQSKESHAETLTMLMKKVKRLEDKLKGYLTMILEVMLGVNTARYKLNTTSVKFVLLRESVNIKSFKLSRKEVSTEEGNLGEDDQLEDMKQKKKVLWHMSFKVLSNLKCRSRELVMKNF
ncbi:hypothetical protein Tco_0359248 [Tanacetum coccineum]